MTGHVIERELIHFFCAPGIMILCLFLIRLLREKKKSWDWIPSRCLPQLIFLAIVIPLMAFLREPYDVSIVGDPTWKSYIDLSLGWVAGAVAGVFAIRWLIKLDWN
jgi:hypothetical protein